MQKSSYKDAHCMMSVKIGNYGFSIYMEFYGYFFPQDNYTLETVIRLFCSKKKKISIIRSLLIIAEFHLIRKNDRKNTFSLETVIWCYWLEKATLFW